MKTPKQWLATFTRRWHTHPHLSATNDPVGYHSGRMAALALHYWPDCSRDLLVACICHDLGEAATGDIPAMVKRNNEYFADQAEWIETDALAEMGMDYEVDEVDRDRLKFLDSLDAYLWARHNAPHLMFDHEWIMAHEWLESVAGNLDVTI